MTIVMISVIWPERELIALLRNGLSVSNLVSMVSHLCQNISLLAVIIAEHRNAEHFICYGDWLWTILSVESVLTNPLAS